MITESKKVKSWIEYLTTEEKARLDKCLADYVRFLDTIHWRANKCTKHN